MIAHFDYLIYNTVSGVKIQKGLPYNQYPKTKASKDALHVFPAGFLSLIDYEIVQPRSPYLWALQCVNTKLRCSGTYSNPVVHVEVPGTACDILEKSHDLDALVIERGPSLTRLDVAIDFETDIQPGPVATSCGNKNFSNTTTIISKTGHTEYVGSLKSDRFARVYRYYPPAPRHKYLRIEHVFKRQFAALAAETFGVGGWDGLLSAIGDVWKWGHELWTESVNVNPGDARKIGWTREKKISKTLRWLETQVAPSLVKLIENGEIENLEDWLIAHVYGKLSNS